MKKFLTLSLAAALLAPAIAPTVAMAQPGHDRGHDRGHDERGDHRGPGGPGWNGGHPDGPPAGWRQFRRGERFDRARAWQYADVDYRRYDRLRPPPRGYHWVRNGNDALLVGIASGVVASVIVGAIR